MKIEQTVRDSYDRQYALNNLVLKEVVNFSQRLDEKWHFVGRLKSAESFAQKIESGSFTDKLTIEDFYACTIVVRNSSEVKAATALVEANFRVDYRRPYAPDETRSRPTEFMFDDLRLYVRLNESFHGPRPIDDIIFEIQIKTFLQHAWGIATHDLTYKTDEIRWSRLRVAYQIRAMLEHAELSIEQFDELEKSPSIAKRYPEYVELIDLIRGLRSRWNSAALPRDLQRLARSIRTAIRKLGVTVKQTFDAIDEETADGRGALSLGISPYAAVMQSILTRCPIDGKAAARRDQGKQIALSTSVNVPEHLKAYLDDLFKRI